MKFIALIFFSSLCLLLFPIQELSAQRPLKDKKTGEIFWMHMIQDTEALHQIAKQYGLSTLKIKEYNNLKSNAVDSLRYLKIPVAIKKSSIIKEEGKYLLHKVERGEKLHEIADMYNTDLRGIKILNHYIKNKLIVGQHILVPNVLPSQRGVSRLVMNGHGSLGFFSGDDWNGEKSTSYFLRGRVNMKNSYKSNDFRNITRVYSTIGYRHVIGRYFYKNVDQFSIDNQLQYLLKPDFALYSLVSLRSQFLDTKHYFESGNSALVSSFMAPAYSNFSLGFVYIGDLAKIDFGLYELRRIYVLQEKVYGDRSYVFGVPRGDKFISVQGMSMRIEFDFYKSEQFNASADIYTFFNKNLFAITYRGELNYHFTKSIRLSLLTEVNWDKVVEATFQYRTELLLGITFNKK